MEKIPATRSTALRLGLVTNREMVGALRTAVSDPASGISIVTVQDIRRIGRLTAC